jgi:hypothetical protein
MINTRLGIVQSQTLQARNCCSCLMQVISKFQHHNAQSISPMWEMEMYWILWCIRISDFQIAHCSYGREGTCRCMWWTLRGLIWGRWPPFAIFGSRFGLRGDGFKVSGRQRRDHCPWLGRLYRLPMWLWLLLGRLEGPRLNVSLLSVLGNC